MFFVFVFLCIYLLYPEPKFKEDLILLRKQMKKGIFHKAGIKIKAEDDAFFWYCSGFYSGFFQATGTTLRGVIVPTKDYPSIIKKAADMTELFYYDSDLHYIEEPRKKAKIFASFLFDEAEQSEFYSSFREARRSLAKAFSKTLKKETLE